MVNIIILFGAPGSGKGTQGDNLSSSLGLRKLSTGDILRQSINKKLDLGLKSQSYINRGDLVPDSLVNKMVMEELASKDCKNGVILDGYPRTVEQAEYLEREIKNLYDEVVFKVLYIKVNEKIVLERILGRFFCKLCKECYNEKYKPLKNKDVCDKCDSKEFFKREDDKEEIILSRISNYNKLSEDLINFFLKRKFLYEIDGSLSFSEVEKTILKLINS